VSLRRRPFEPLFLSTDNFPSLFEPVFKCRASDFENLPRTGEKRAAEKLVPSNSFAADGEE